MESTNDFEIPNFGEKASLSREFDSIEIPGIDKEQNANPSAEPKVDPNINYSGDFAEQVNGYDQQFVPQSVFDTLDLSSSSSDLARKALEESSEIEKKRNQRPAVKPSLLALFNKSNVFNQSYLPHHVALPQLIQNNNRAKHLTNTLNMQAASYEKAAAAYEQILADKGYFSEKLKAEKNLPYEYRTETKKLLADPEVMQAMGVLSESHNRLNKTLNSKECQDVMGLSKNGELGDSTQEALNISLSSVSQGKFNNLAGKDIPIVDGGKLIDLDKKLESLAEEVKKITDSILRMFTKSKGLNL